MNPMNELVTQSRGREVARAASHPGRLAKHELRLADRAARTTRSGDLVPGARPGLPAVAGWVAALVAAVFSRRRLPSARTRHHHTTARKEPPCPQPSSTTPRS